MVRQLSMFGLQTSREKPPWQRRSKPTEAIHFNPFVNGQSIRRDLLTINMDNILHLSWPKPVL
jgi:hypothetical protein